MSKLSAKNKIFALLALWLVLSAAMFMYFFGLLDASNQNTLTSISQLKNNLAVLRAESDSYKRAQSDLDTLAKEQYQPQDFFSKDITLVKEIQSLEDLSQKLGVQMQLSGVSGTVSSAPKAQTLSSIVEVPYGITVIGTLPQVTDFVETWQNMAFITDVYSFSLNASAKGMVTETLGGNFYLQNSN